MPRLSGVPDLVISVLIQTDYFLVHQSEIKEELIDADTKNFTR